MDLIVGRKLAVGLCTQLWGQRKAFNLVSLQNWRWPRVVGIGVWPPAHKTRKRSWVEELT